MILRQTHNNGSLDVHLMDTQKEFQQKSQKIQTFIFIIYISTYI